MMALVFFTASAGADLADIVPDLAVKAGIETAERYAAEFDALFTRLAEFPDIGSPRPRLGARSNWGRGALCRVLRP